MKTHLSVGLLSLFICAATAFGQKMNVTIVQRHDSTTTYDYVVAGHYYGTSNGSTDCDAYGNNADCYGSTTTSGYTVPGHEVSFSVSGATYSLLLPDGRIVVVNCVSKFAERFAGVEGNHRSCRMPIVNDIQAEFKGKKAKLSWPVSLDGKKKESETYTILGILPKQK